jgi:hypothetical protein
MKVCVAAYIRIANNLALVIYVVGEDSVPLPRSAQSAEVSPGALKSMSRLFLRTA